MPRLTTMYHGKAFSRRMTTTTQALILVSCAFHVACPVHSISSCQAAEGQGSAAVDNNAVAYGSSPAVSVGADPHVGVLPVELAGEMQPSPLSLSLLQLPASGLQVSGRAFLAVACALLQPMQALLPAPGHALLAVSMNRCTDCIRYIRRDRHPTLHMHRHTMRQTCARTHNTHARAL